jgi:hypothetical protein
MLAKTNVAAIAVAMTALVIPVVASAHVRTEHRLNRHVNQLNSTALSSAYASANSAAHRRGALDVVAPDGRYLGTDPDPAIRFELGRDFGRGT